MREKKNPDERKQEIIRVAGELFTTNGYKKTQVKDIVQTIGVAQGLFYYYFKSKEEVMQAVAEQYAEEIIERIRKEISEDKSILENIETVINMFILTADEKNKLFMEIQSADNGIIQNNVRRSIGKKLIPIVVSIIKQGNKHHECDCSNPELSAEFCIYGFFSILNELTPENKLRYLSANLTEFKVIITRVLGLKSGGQN